MSEQYSEQFWLEVRRPIHVVVMNAGSTAQGYLTTCMEPQVHADGQQSEIRFNFANYYATGWSSQNPIEALRRRCLPSLYNYIETRPSDLVW